MILTPIAKSSPVGAYWICQIMLYNSTATVDTLSLTTVFSRRFEEIQTSCATLDTIV